MDLSGDTPWPEPYGSSADWRRAAAGDDAVRAHLADRHTPGTLLPLILRGGAFGRAALAVASHLPDPYPLSPALCSHAARAQDATARLLAAALLQATLRGPATEEAVDPAWRPECLQKVRGALDRDDLGPETRDLLSAVSDSLAAR